MMKAQLQARLLDVAKISAAIRQYEFSHELANRMVTQQGDHPRADSLPGHPMDEAI